MPSWEIIVFVLRFRLLTYWSVPYMIEPLSSRNSRPLPDDAAVFRLVSACLVDFLAAFKRSLGKYKRATLNIGEKTTSIHTALVETPAPHCRPLYTYSVFQFRPTPTTLLGSPASSRRFLYPSAIPCVSYVCICFTVRNFTRMANEEAGSGPFWGKPEWRGEEGYYKMLASSFADLISSGEDKRRHIRCKHFSRGIVGGKLHAETMLFSERSSSG